MEDDSDIDEEGRDGFLPGVFEAELEKALPGARYSKKIQWFTEPPSESEAKSYKIPCSFGEDIALSQKCNHLKNKADVLLFFSTIFPDALIEK